MAAPKGPSGTERAIRDVVKHLIFHLLDGRAVWWSSARPGAECIALALRFAQYQPMPARVLSAAVNGIQAFPVEVEVNSGWGDTTVVILSCNIHTFKLFRRPFFQEGILSWFQAFCA